MFGLEPSTAFYFMRLPLPRQAVFFSFGVKKGGVGSNQLLRQLAGDIRDAFPFGPYQCVWAKGYTGREDLRKPSGYRCPCRRAAALPPSTFSLAGTARSAAGVGRARRAREPTPPSLAERTRSGAGQAFNRPPRQRRHLSPFGFALSVLARAD